MGVVTPAVRFAALGLIVLCVAGLVWRGVVIYQEDQRAQRAALLADAGPVGLEPGVPLTFSAHTTTTAPSTSPAPAPAPEKRQLVVHVAGAVSKPGVYTFEEGARVHDAVERAGGALPEGVPDALNLAALLTDGAKVYIYTRAELEPAAAPPPMAREATYAPVTTAEPAQAKGSQARVVNINTASAAELESVPGIGPATARAIIEHRTKRGAFQRIEDLTAVSGIGPKTLERLRPYLKV
ncbi:MAG: helix-hairpin-helix domain-containing protein [Bacillota bacterium]